IAFDNVTTALTVTAQYTINTYSVRFEDWDGSELKTESVNHGSSATAPADPTRVGYTFTGWDIAFDNVTTALTVTAQYTINTYSVRFEDWDGSELKTETVNHGSSATAPANPTRVGYTFTGWDVAFDNVTTALTVTAQYDIANNVFEEGSRHFAIYPNPATTYFTVDGAGGNTLSIFNRAGILVKQITNIHELQRVDVDGLPTGIYMVKVGLVVRRVVIH
uniref:InlB B-repeat-containing protein n=1 Tax=Carboxylicivirga sp. 1411-1 TaxID=3417573 RepID=UPI003D34C7FA